MRKLFSLIAAVLFAGGMSAAMYNAVQVNKVKEGGLYIFECNNHVLINSTGSNNKLQTMDTYSKMGLAGNERYIWTLESVSTDSFKIITKAEGATHVELNNQSKSTNIAIANAGAGCPWKITFDENDIALISTYNAGYAEGNRDRFLGETEANSNEYRAYAMSDLDNRKHDFKVYELQESSDPYVNADVLEVDFKTVEKDATVASKEVKVSFGNLTGSVTYAGLTAPFSAEGKIVASGNVITISASTATIGEYNQTLIISSVDDNAKVEVVVKMKVIEPADPSSKFTLFTGDLVEGDYVIYYNGYAMNNAPVGKDKNGKDIMRLGYVIVEPQEDVIAEADASIVWHIAPAGDYWTLYNAAVEKYAAATTAKNQLDTIASGTDDTALWSVTAKEGKYDFENKARAAATSDPNNKWLRNNGTNGFACYLTSMGGALSLYKKGSTPTAITNTKAGEKATKMIKNGQLIILKNGVRYNAQGALLR